MTFFVYKHTNKINGKAYIGWTSFSLEKRLKTHLSQAKSGSSYAFHRALRKYNIDNWTSVLRESNKRIKKEQQI